MTKIFIDGSAGTTGLRIRERLAEREGIEILALPEELRKDVEARREALGSADIAFLCLPDAAAIEAVGLMDNDHTAIIDTSTAHSTADGWTYGFPEMVGVEAIAKSKRIAKPGCHASGFVALVARCIAEGKVLEELPLEVYKEYSDLFTEDVYHAIDLATCVAPRISEGGTSVASVEAQISYVTEQLA